MKVQKEGLRLLVQVAVIAIGFSALAMATTINVGSPGASGNDWNQTMNTGNSTPFTQMQASIDTTGVDFSGPFTGLPSGWTSTQYSPQLVDMSGPSSTGNFNFTMSFTSAQSTPFTIDWDIFNGAALDPWPDSGLTAWNGSGWSASQESPEDPSADTPEPASLLLLATGLLGIAPFLVRHLLHV